VRAHSARPTLLAPHDPPTAPTVLDPEAGAVIHMDLKCTSAGGSDVVVNIVDNDSYEIVGNYLVSVSASLPSVKELYQLEVAAHTGASKKIAFTNPYDAPRKFSLETDRPDLLMFTQSDLQLGPKETAMIAFILSPSSQRGGTSIYIFVNDEMGRNEDTLQLVVSYF
jgi:nephrocystin-4